jgi:hypothetical protein
MLTRFGSCLLAACAGVVLTAQPAAAQQTVNFSFGYFSVRGEDARVEGDIVNENRNLLVFDVDEFSGASVYDELVDSDGTEIDQDLRLRIVPVSFTIRVLPLGRATGIQPYFGGGLGRRYSESGEFVDFATRPPTIFRDQFVSSGSTTGPIALGGVRFAGSAFSAGFEVRYHSADAALGEDFEDILDEPRIDLGGWTYQATFGFRFGG